MPKKLTLRKAHSTNTQKWLKTSNTKWLQMKVRLSILLSTAILELVLLRLIMAHLHT